MLNRTKLDLRSSIVKNEAARLRSDVAAVLGTPQRELADAALLMLALGRCDALQHETERLHEVLRAELDERVLS